MSTFSDSKGHASLISRSFTLRWVYTERHAYLVMIPIHHRQMYLGVSQYSKSTMKPRYRDNLWKCLWYRKKGGSSEDRTILRPPNVKFRRNWPRKNSTGHMNLIPNPRAWKSYCITPNRPVDSEHDTIYREWYGLTVCRILVTHPTGLIDRERRRQSGSGLGKIALSMILDSERKVWVFMR